MKRHAVKRMLAMILAFVMATSAIVYASVSAEESSNDYYGYLTITALPETLPSEVEYDEYGNPIVVVPEVEYDEYGNPIVVVPEVEYDEDGNPIVIVPEVEYDEYGNPVVVVPEVEYDEDGEAYVVHPVVPEVVVPPVLAPLAVAFVPFSTTVSLDSVRDIRLVNRDTGPSANTPPVGSNVYFDVEFLDENGNVIPFSDILAEIEGSVGAISLDGLLTPRAVSNPPLALLPDLFSVDRNTGVGTLVVQPDFTDREITVSLEWSRWITNDDQVTFTVNYTFTPDTTDTTPPPPPPVVTTLHISAPAYVLPPPAETAVNIGFTLYDQYGNFYGSRLHSQLDITITNSLIPDTVAVFSMGADSNWLVLAPGFVNGYITITASLPDNPSITDTVTFFRGIPGTGDGKDNQGGNDNQGGGAQPPAIRSIRIVGLPAYVPVLDTTEFPVSIEKLDGYGGFIRYMQLSELWIPLEFRSDLETGQILFGFSPFEDRTGLITFDVAYMDDMAIQGSAQVYRGTPQQPGNGGGNNNNQGGGNHYTGGGYVSDEPSVPTTTVSIPANEGETSISVRITENNAVLRLPTSTLNVIIDNVEDGIVTLDLSSLDVETVAVPRTAMRRFANEGLGLEIVLPQGTIAFSAEAVYEIGQIARHSRITVEIVEVEYELEVSIISGGIVITDLEGEITVILPELEELEEPEELENE
ncbi:MAG: hypothetical protein FWB91_07555 [Defluviitaleaceae bacterium]|nr:hypothetical protein [Defluviitaleaceae bacterium]